MSTVTELRRDPDVSAARPAVSEAPALWRRTGVRMAVVALLLVLAGGLLTQWLADRWAHVAIDDSRIAATLVTVSSEVSGRLLKVPVVAGDSVKRGTLLAAIDREQAELELRALESQIRSIEAQQSQLRAEQDMVRIQVARKMEAGQAEVAAAESVHASSEVALRNAKIRFARAKKLEASKIVPAQELEQAQTELSVAEQQERTAAAHITTAQANLAVTKTEETKFDVLDRQIAMLEAQKSAETADRDRKRIDIAHGVIKAEFDGVVDGTFVDAGEYVSPGTRLLIYHDPKTVWVEANVKETDFRRLKIDAPAKVFVDAYPGRTFTGRVVRLGEAATSQFALLPSPNPSGNFTKITQRLPIRLSIDQQDNLLRPGMMVEVSVDAVD
jgi:membrane fusion protein (multidrug efflux system)